MSAHAEAGITADAIVLCRFGLRSELDPDRRLWKNPVEKSISVDLSKNRAIL
jgi:hypothetical protein